VTYLASGSGGPDGAYRYDPFGRWLAQTGSYAGANGMRFSSKPWLAHNGSNTEGLYSYGYRFYDPLTQRWLNRDPINELGFNLLIRSQDAFNFDEEKNLYAFVHNDPLNRIDPDGRWAAIIREALKRAAPHLAKCKKLRCKVALHGPDHTFPRLGKKCHIQATCWIKGSKGSGVNLRIPVPDFMCPKKKPPTTPGTTPPASPSAGDAGGEDLGEVEIE
jgi:RHS repeat-associated protein